MATVALQQVSSKYARENEGRTLAKPVALKFIYKYLDPAVLARLEAACDNSKVYIWGAKFERSHQLEKMLPKRCLVLFRRGNTVHKCGVVLEWVVNEELAEHLWGYDRDGQTWGLVYFFRTIRDLAVPAEKINKAIGRVAHDHWQGLTVIRIPETEDVIAFIKAELQGRSASTGEAGASVRGARGIP